ncbi:MAG TPA: ROK family protein [Kiritimatiellia bacterium]|nr:ROK family protein [Kiritimatiellia bacterium]HMO98394.1 ROK family protein [Kiritimatiellia bacterium]HMP96447.1 ROK family protein [Kiritimatiellia bacterium]
MTTVETRYAVGVDFGGTSVKIALVDDRGNLLAQERIITEHVKDRSEWLDAVCRAINAIKGERTICGVGVGVPGFVDYDRGYIYDLANVPGWTGVPLADLLEERLHLPVRIDNDVNAMALGECTFGAGRTFQHAVFVTLGTGVGGALLIHNQLYRGAHSMAGEIGHVSIDMNGRVSPQGKGGLEQYVGNRRIIERAVEALEAGRASMIDDLCQGDRFAISPKIIKEAAVKGDALALEILDFVTDCIATAFASIAYILQPQAFIVGGGVAQDADLLFELLRKHLAERLSPHFFKKLEIKTAELGPDAGMIGCATLALME